MSTSAARYIVQRGDPRWLEIAAGEQGQHEIPGPQDNPRILAYASAVDLHVTHDEVPWCAIGANWCLEGAGYKGTRSALAVSFLGYGRPALEAEFHGAIVVLCRRDAAPDPDNGSPTGNHVAFGLSQTAEYVELLGGNQGDQWKVSHFPRSAYRVRAVRMPRECDRRTA